MIFLVWVAVCLVVLILIYLVLAWKLCNVVILPRKESLEETLDYEIRHNYITREEYDNLHRVPFRMIKKDGSKITGDWILPENETNKIMILCHGYNSNRTGSYKYVLAYLRLGFKVLIYDHCHCGLSDGKYTTMGYQESKDLESVIDEVIKEHGEKHIIGTHGESMGAATVLLHACRDSRISFVVADCPYADLKQQLAYRLKVEYHLSPFLILPLASLIAKLRAGFYFGEVSPIRELQKNNGLENTPILFVHGLDDDYIPYDASERLYKQKKGMKRLYLCPGAKHVESFKTNPIKYQEELDTFLKQIIR